MESDGKPWVGMQMGCSSGLAVWSGLRLTCTLRSLMVFMRSLLRTAHFILSELSQFPDIVEFCEMMANEGKTVIVAALDGTFQRKVKISDPGLQRILRGETVDKVSPEVGLFRIEAVGWWVL